MKRLVTAWVTVCCGIAAAGGLAALPAAAGAVVTAPGKAIVGLAPHRAVYDMSLGDLDDSSGISGVNGRMVYDFSGNSCDGYSVSFRFVTEFQDVDGGSQITDMQTTSFEEPHAKSYRFLTKTYVDQKLVESSSGTARAVETGKVVDLKEPSEKSLPFDGTVMFPTQHLSAVIDAAKRGEHFLTAEIFDGAETGDRIYATTAVIGPQVQPANPISAERGKADAVLSGLAYWPVTIAYFDPAEDASGEATPVYELSFWLYENGISQHLTLDYGDFTIEGKMTSLELYDETDCAN